MIYKIGALILAGLLALGGFIFPTPTPAPTPPEVTQSDLDNLGDYVLKLGATIPTPVASFSTSLAASITSSDTSMDLVSILTDDGTSLTTGTVYGFVIDANTGSEEFVLGTASSTTITGLTRGVSVITGNTEVSALKKSHRRGSSVKITDAPVLLVMARILNGDETLPNVLQYDSSIATSTIAASNQNLVNVGLLNDTSITGALDATTAVKGLVELGTAAEIAAGTATGGTGASLVAPSSLFASTTSATTLIPVTLSSGLLRQSWLDLTEAWTFTGAVSMASASSTSITVNGLDVESKLSKFGGDGSDGALTASSTIDLGNAAIVVKNYTEISLTGTSKLTFTNPATKGTTIILKSQGDVTITCTSAPCIDTSALGGAGGAGGTGAGSNNNTTGRAGGGGSSIISDGTRPSIETISASGDSGCSDGSAGSDGLGLSVNTGGAGGLCISNANTNNTVASNPLGFSKSFQLLASSTPYLKAYPLIPGSGGGGGGGGNGSGRDGTAGGRGGGALMLEVGGALNFTIAGGISVAGENGTNSADSNDRCGSGGGAGVFFGLYNTLTANSGTITVTGGSTGSGGCGAGFSGASGYGAFTKNTDF